MIKEIKKCAGCKCNNGILMERHGFLWLKKRKKMCDKFFMELVKEIATDILSKEKVVIGKDGNPMWFKKENKTSKAIKKPSKKKITIKTKTVVKRKKK